MKPTLGQHKYDITVVPHQDGWKAEFEIEACRLQDALGGKALRIEHIGSTAIPGLVAKPIIDIMLAVQSLAQAGPCSQIIPVLAALGYQYRLLDPVPERMFFAKESAPEIRTHHLHLTQLGSGFWKKQLAFRDYLREHDQVADEYSDLKVRLAEEYARTQQLDREGKTEFVARVLELAEREAKSG